MECSTSDNLLDEITEKWATGRGHSFANGWIELYLETKRESKTRKVYENSYNKNLVYRLSIMI